MECILALESEGTVSGPQSAWSYHDFIKMSSKFSEFSFSINKMWESDTMFSADSFRP